MNNKKELVFFITHSLGELDVVLPIICKMNSNKGEYSFCIVFVVRSLYDNFIANDFYKKVFRLLQIDQGFIHLPNKFDSKNSSNNIFLRVKNRIEKYYINPIKIAKLYFIINKSFVIFHEFSCQYSSVKVLYLLSKINKKSIFTYIHGHACNIDTKQKKVPFCTKYSHLLNFHDHSTFTYLNAGYEEQSIIGYPKFYPEWRMFVEDNFNLNPINEKFALIFTRPINPYYMDENKYCELLNDTLSSIHECFGESMLVIIKPHPREDEDYIHRVLSNLKVRYEISRIDSSVLSMHAHIAISFWTSAVLSSLAFGVPSIEFYKEAQRFREVEPSGSSYKKLGIASVNNKEDLILFMQKVISGNYRPPISVLKIFNKYSSTNISNILTQNS